MKKETIYKIVKASGVSEGEMVLVHFWGEDKDKEIANSFLTAVASLGATPLLLQESRSLNRDMFSNAKDTCFDQRFYSILSAFDAILDVFTYQPVVLGYEMDADKLALYRQYMAQMFQALMKAKRFTQIRIPTEVNAEETELEPSDYIRRMESAYDIDYDMLYTSCVKTKEKMEPLKQLVLKTGENCELFFDLEGRSWYIDAGDGDMPCGEIYIAPNESKTSGSVYFEKLFIEEEGEYANVILDIEEGKVIGSNCEEVTSYFNQLSPADNVICELGFGMNPNISDLCGCAVLDEKMAGTFHLAIGANQMFGGQNEASLHMDFVGSKEYEIMTAEGRI